MNERLAEDIRQAAAAEAGKGAAWESKDDDSELEASGVALNAVQLPTLSSQRALRSAATMGSQPFPIIARCSRIEESLWKFAHEKILALCVASLKASEVPMPRDSGGETARNPAPLPSYKTLLEAFTSMWAFTEEAAATNDPTAEDLRIAGEKLTRTVTNAYNGHPVFRPLMLTFRMPLGFARPSPLVAWRIGL